MVSYGTVKSLASAPEVKLRTLVRKSNFLTEKWPGDLPKVSSFNNCRARPISFRIWRSWDRTSWYISIVRPTRCTIFRVYWVSLYVFRTVFPSIIWSPRLYVQRQVYVIQVRWPLTSGHEMELSSSISCFLASSQRTSMPYTWCCMYSFGLQMMDGKTVRNMRSDIQ